MMKVFNELKEFIESYIVMKKLLENSKCALKELREENRIMITKPGEIYYESELGTFMVDVVEFPFMSFQVVNNNIIKVLVKINRRHDNELKRKLYVYDFKQIENFDIENNRVNKNYLSYAYLKYMSLEELKAFFIKVDDCIVFSK